MQACRNNGSSEDDARDAVLACVRPYRERMREFSKMRVTGLVSNTAAVSGD